MDPQTTHPDTPPPGTELPAEQTLSAANRAFHAAYSLWIDKTMDRLGGRGFPVIMVHEDKMMLMHGDVRKSVITEPEEYHRLKAIGHAAFGLFVLLMENGYGPIHQEARELLEGQMDLLHKASQSIADFGLPEGCEASQQHVLDGCVELAEEVLSTQKIDEARVQSYVEHVQPHLMDGAAYAAAMEIDLIHETVTAWRELLHDYEWQNLYVIISGGHQARYRETSVQYFHRLLHEQQGLGAELEDRVVFAEGAGGEEEMLLLLARHINDQVASNAFFGNRTRMQQDFLADATAAHLEKVLPTQ